MRRLIEDLRDTMDYVLNDFVNLTNRRLYIAYMVIQETGERLELLGNLTSFDYKGYGIRKIEDVFLFVSQDGKVLPDELSVAGKKVNGISYMDIEETIKALQHLPDYIKHILKKIESLKEELNRISIPMEVAR